MKYEIWTCEGGAVILPENIQDKNEILGIGRKRSPDSTFKLFKSFEAKSWDVAKMTFFENVGHAAK